MPLLAFAINTTVSTNPAEALDVVAEALEKRYEKGTDETNVEFLTRLAENFLANEFKSVYADSAGSAARKTASLETQEKVTVTPIKNKPSAAGAKSAADGGGVSPVKLRSRNP